MQHDLDHIFAYHAPTPDQAKAYGLIREAGKASRARTRPKPSGTSARP